MADNELEIKVTARDDSKRGLDSAAKGIKGVGDAAEKSGTKVKGFSGIVDTATGTVMGPIADGAERAQDKLKGLGDGVDRTSDRLRGLDGVVGRGGRAFGDYGTGLGGVGDRADEVDTRMMGLSDGIQGVTDLMGGNGKLRPHEMAMAFSDLGSAAYNTVIPSMQSVVKATKGMSVAMAASVVGLAALAAGAVYLAFTQKSTSIDVDKTTKALESQDAAVKVSMQETLAFVASWGHLPEVFDEVLEKTPQVADEFIAQAEAAGASEEELDAMREKLEEVADTSDFLADKIRGVADAIRAQSDPVFAALDSMNQLADANAAVGEAQAALNVAVAEFGAGSPEAIQAEQDLAAAHQEAATSAFGQEQAMLDLAAEMQASGTSVEGIIAHMQGLEVQGLISQATVDAVTAALGRVPGQVGASIIANDLASGIIGRVSSNLDLLDGKSATVRINQLFRSVGSAFGFGNAHGGVTGAIGQAAGGGVRNAQTLVGERGPELVDLPFGSTVTPAGTTAAMLGGGGGGAPVQVGPFYIQGSIRSDRDLVKLIRDEFDRGGFS